jgi:FemAB-related protein (PEP-CTERM system-associated)
LSEIVVRPFHSGDETCWDGYVRRHAHGTPFHLTAWKRSIEETYSFRSVYQVAEQDGTVRGVLPLFEIWNPVMGRVLISTPFAVYGGALADDDEVRAKLRAVAEKLGRERQVQYVELRNAKPEQAVGWDRVDRYATFQMPIGPDPEAILAALPRETRRMTRRALEHPYEVQVTRELEPFFSVYSANLRRLGTPAFSRRHFLNLLRLFPDADIREIRLEGQVVAVVMNLYFGDQVLPYYGASDPEFNRCNPNNFMYYDLMCAAGGRGLKLFDFGRSKLGSGSYAFKSRWGMQEWALPYEILLVKRKELPNFSPANPKYELAIQTWSKLPLWLTNAVGPALIRLFP